MNKDMKVYVIGRHWEDSGIFVTKKLAEKELQKQKDECPSCKNNSSYNINDEHYINEYDAK